MCWSGEASAVLAVAGLGITAYLIKSGEKRELWLVLFYFTLMELLQAITYIYINQCSLTTNKMLTLLGYIHIGFQPIFINMLAMHFIPQAVKNKISPYVYGICWSGAAIYMLKAYPFSNTALCSVGTETFCGPFACSYKGNWHIAWQLPLNNLLSNPLVTLWNASFLNGLHAKIYFLNSFALPILYGSWRVILLSFLLGPFIAFFSTNNINEFSAIWCLYSIGLCCTIIKTPIRKYLFVQGGPFYRYIINRTQVLTDQQSSTSLEPTTPPTPTTPIHSPTLPLHEFQLMYWLSGFSKPVYRTLNRVERRRFQGTFNKLALDAALQLVLQKQEIFSYHLHRFYPLHTLCTKPSVHFRQSTETSLHALPDDAAEAYLTQQYEKLYYEKNWRVNRPWISIDLYALKHDQIELQVCMSQLIADEHSMMIFFRELSNAYLFFTHQTHAYILDSFQSYQNYITQQNMIWQQQASTDELFWKNYLQDASLFCVPKQHIVPHRKPAPTQIALPESFVLKLQQFCTQYRVALQDVLCAAVSLTLLQCCDNDTACITDKLCISTVKSTRDDPQYANTMGCFLRMDTIKLDLHHQPSLVNVTKQAQAALRKTAQYQRSPTLVKFAAMGKLPKTHKPFTKFLVRTSLACITKCFPKWQLNQNIVRACEHLATADKKKQFLICIDTSDHFLAETKPTVQSDLFGLVKEDIPLYMAPAHSMNYVLNIIFHRNNDQKMPFLTIVGNLAPKFKTRFGENLIAMVHNAD